jgi:hypothetical protein
MRSKVLDPTLLYIFGSLSAEPKAKLVREGGDSKR